LWTKSQGVFLGDELEGKWKGLSSEEFAEVYFPPSIISLAKLRRMR
jgi:hypothetical protein